MLSNVLFCSYLYDAYMLSINFIYMTKKVQNIKHDKDDKIVIKKLQSYH